MRQGSEIQDSQQFYQQLEEEELATLKKHHRGRKGTRGSKGSSNIQSLHKEALFDSFLGRFQEASKKLKHMITLNPDNPEPYQVLGNMHQQNGELDKAAQYLFMSTFLSPPNLGKWLKVGQLSFQRKMYSQAAYCFGRALKITPCDPKIMIRRAEAFELSGQFKKAITTYKRLLTISQSPQYIKKYAKIRYKKGEYQLCRQTLQQIENYLLDANIVYMFCETYLQEHQYTKLAEIVQKHLQLRTQMLEESEALSVQFIVILFICSVALKRQCFGLSSQVLIQQIKQCYDDDYADLYTSSITHISKFNQQMTFNLTHFLIKYPQHQTINNFVIVIDYLCKQRNTSCLQILENGLKLFGSSPEMLAERDYVYKYFGIQNTMRKRDQDIYYSSEEEEIPFLAVPQTKKIHYQQADTQVIAKLLHNVSQALELLIDQIKKGNVPGIKQQQTILDGLELFITLSPPSKQQNIDEPQGLFMKKVVKRRTIDGESRPNLINQNIGILQQYFQKLVTYLQCLLQTKQWRKLIQIGEKVSKVHVFKNHNRNIDFISIKIKIYQMCVYSCLFVHKFNTGLFFLRFLVTKHPEDSLYALALHYLLRICPKKTFITSALNRRIYNPQGQKLARLLAIQYMQTGCFELAISAFLRSSHNEQTLGATPQLCIAACMIQIASSRNTYNKLDFTNRSAICLSSYQNVCQNKEQVLFNRARWYSQVKLNQKAIVCYQKILGTNEDKALKQRAAYCLINIYRQCDQYTKANALSRQYFPIP